MMRFRCAAYLFAVGVVAHASAQAPAPVPVKDEFTQLMAAFEHMPGLEASFVEHKQLGLLAQPLENRGRLYFTRPGLFLRRVESPRRSDVIITPKEVKLRDADGEQRIDLASRAEVRPFVQSLTWLLAGDHAALRSVYTIEFVPGHDQTPWQLTLTPKSDPIARLITHMRVLGTGLRVTEIQVRERSGDESITRILEANPERHFSRAELVSLFGVQPAKAPGGKP
ncbi:MAG: hypothetical protein RL701_5328 [Pseudomonadota bacterium]|jgi:outer membrane lipoprotein-sorting protein